MGASHAGAQLVASLRQEGWTGEIVLVGEESALPYQRPPLSKAFLTGRCAVGELAIRSADFYAKQQIRILDATVQAIDRTAKHVSAYIGKGLVDPEVIAKALRSPNTNLVANPHEIMESTALLQDFQQTTGAQIKPVDLNQLFDHSFFDAVRKAG